MESFQLSNIISITSLAVTTTLSVLASLVIATTPVLLIYLLSKQQISRIPTEKDIKLIDELELEMKAIEEEMVAKNRTLFSKGRLQLRRIIRTIRVEYINLSYTI